VHAICRMRPNFDHLDERDKKAKADKVKEEKLLQSEREAQERDDGDYKPVTALPASCSAHSLFGTSFTCCRLLQGDDGKEESQPKQVIVKMKRKESEKSAAYRKLTHGFLKSKEEAEPWIELKFNKADVRRCLHCMRMCLHHSFTRAHTRSLCCACGGRTPTYACIQSQAAMKHVDKLVTNQTAQVAASAMIPPNDFMPYINIQPPKPHSRYASISCLSIDMCCSFCRLSSVSVVCMCLVVAVLAPKGVSRIALRRCRVRPSLPAQRRAAPLRVRCARRACSPPNRLSSIWCNCTSKTVCVLCFSFLPFSFVADLV
jgi:hypothetical protein